MYSNIDFQNYLSSSKDATCVLNLSKSSVLEIVEEIIKMKSKIYPTYGKSYSSLKYHLNALEKEFNCTLMPHQITDIFWHKLCNPCALCFIKNKFHNLENLKFTYSLPKGVIETNANYNL